MKIGNALNDPKLNLNTKQSKLPCIHYRRCPRGPNFRPFCSISRFRDTTCTRSAKIGNAPNDSKLTLNTVKSTLYTLKTYPWGPNFHPFLSMTSRFRDTRSSKNRNAPSDPKLNLNTVKRTLCILNTYPWGPNFGQFYSTTGRFPGRFQDIAHFIIPHWHPC